MNNRFKSGETDARMKIIQKMGGVNAFEHNIENLLL